MRHTWLHRVVLAMSFFVGSAAAASVPTNQTTQSELRKWSEYYWFEADTGQPKAGAAQFRFTDARYNTPLVSPVRGAVRSLQRLKPAVRFETNDPQRRTIGGIPWMDVRKLMLNGEIETDMAADFDTAATHIFLVLQNETLNPDGSDMGLDETELSIIGTSVKTKNFSPAPVLPPAPDQEEGDTYVPAPDEASFFANLAGIARNISGGMDVSASRASDLILGREPYYEEFGFALHRQVLRSGTTMPTQVSLVEANFGRGVFSLVLTCVQAGQAYALFDPLTGNMAGPFHVSMHLNARQLVSSYPNYYAPGDPLEYVWEDGAVVAGIRAIGDSDTLPSPVTLPPDVDPMHWSCLGCIACVAAVTASCGVLCVDQPYWDTPGEGFGKCMAKCAATALGMPLSISNMILGTTTPVSEEAILAMTACDIACAGCSGHVAKYLRKWAMGPIRAIQRDPMRILLVRP